VAQLVRARGLNEVAREEPTGVGDPLQVVPETEDGADVELAAEHGPGPARLVMTAVNPVVYHSSFA